VDSAASADLGAAARESRVGCSVVAVSIKSNDHSARLGRDQLVNGTSSSMKSVLGKRMIFSALVLGMLSGRAKNRR